MNTSKEFSSLGLLRQRLDEGACFDPFDRIQFIQQSVDFAFSQADLPLGIDELLADAKQILTNEVKASSVRSILDQIVERYKARVLADLSHYIDLFLQHIFQLSEISQDKLDSTRFTDGLIKLLDDFALLGLSDQSLPLVQARLEQSYRVAKVNEYIHKRVVHIASNPDVVYGVPLLAQKMENEKGIVDASSLLTNVLSILTRIVQEPYRKNNPAKFVGPNSQPFTSSEAIALFDHYRAQKRSQAQDDALQLLGGFWGRRVELIDLIKMDPRNVANLHPISKPTKSRENKPKRPSRREARRARQAPRDEHLEKLSRLLDE